jgi:hypothetical protein
VTVVEDERLWGARPQRRKYPVCHPGFCWRRRRPTSNSIVLRMKDSNAERCSDCPLAAKVIKE